MSDMPVIPAGSWRDFVWDMHHRGLGVSFCDSHVSVRRNMGGGVQRSVWSNDNGASVTGTLVDLKSTGQQSQARWLEPHEWYSFLGVPEQHPEDPEYGEYLRLKRKFEGL